MNKWIGCVCVLTTFQISAVECLKPNENVKPVLVLRSVTIPGNIYYKYESEFKQKLKDELNASEKFYVVENSYRLYENTRLIDKCTPVFTADIQIKSTNHNLENPFLLGSYTATVNVRFLTRFVPLDDFTVDGKNVAAKNGNPKENKLQNLYSNVFNEFISRQSTWMSVKPPRF